MIKKVKILNAFQEIDKEINIDFANIIESVNKI